MEQESQNVDIRYGHVADAPGGGRFWHCSLKGCLLIIRSDVFGEALPCCPAQQMADYIFQTPEALTYYFYKW